MSEWGDEAGVVRLPDGRAVRGTGAKRPRGDLPPPEFAVYLLGRTTRDRNAVSLHDCAARYA